MKIASLSTLLTQRRIRRIDLARGMCVNKSTVTRWDRAGVPAARVLDVERFTGISRHQIRPDIFGEKPQ